MRVTVLLENTGRDDHLICRHGLSLLIESGDRICLFDAGPDDAFLQNADHLGVDLSKAQFAVLSHGHYDHGGGLPALARAYPDLPIYLRRAAFGDCRNGTGKYIGLEESQLRDAHLIFTDGVQEISPGMTVFGDIRERAYISPINRSLFYGKQPDLFSHEQNLLIEEEGRLFLIGGCAHCGIVNILEKARDIAGRYPDVVLSGMHLSLHGRISGDDFLEELGQKLLSYPSIFYTYHCTGLEPYEKLKNLLGERIVYLPGGSVAVL